MFWCFGWDILQYSSFLCLLWEGTHWWALADPRAQKIHWVQVDLETPHPQLFFNILRGSPNLQHVKSLIYAFLRCWEFSTQSASALIYGAIKIIGKYPSKLMEKYTQLYPQGIFQGQLALEDNSIGLVLCQIQSCCTNRHVISRATKNRFGYKMIH